MISYRVQDGTTILLEKRYDEKVWDIKARFDPSNPDHCSDGDRERTTHTLTGEEAVRLNSCIDGDGYISASIVLTKKGIRVFPF